MNCQTKSELVHFRKFLCDPATDCIQSGSVGLYDTSGGVPVTPSPLVGAESGPDCRHEWPNTHDRHHAFHVVGQHMQCHFGGNVPERFHLEVG